MCDCAAQKNATADLAQAEAGPSRRSVFAVPAAVVAGAATLSACSSSEGTATSTAASAASAGSSAVAAAASIATLSEIAVGSAVVKTVDGKPVVISRTADSTVVGFNGACTHQGCPVMVESGALNCNCHGSKFNIATGAVENGPATQDLASVALKVSGDAISLG